jgi:hypothetical protein
MPPSPAPAVLLLADRDYALATAGPLFFIVWRVNTNIEAVREAHRRMTAHAAARGGHIGLVTIIEAGAPVPSGASRAELAGLLRDANAYIQASAVVFEGDGFRAAAVRSVVTGLNLLARPKFEHKIFGDAGKAFAWLSTALRGLLDPSMTPAMLVAMTEELRRRIDAKVPAYKPR